MINKFLVAYNNNFEDCNSLFDVNCYFDLNGKVNTDLNAIQKYFNQLKAGLSHFDIKVSKIIFTNEEMTAFTWRMQGKHTGVFYKLMPSHRDLQWEGSAILKFKNNKIIEFIMQFDEQTIVNQICVSNERIYNSQEVINDLDGPAKNIYKLILSTRSGLTDSKQTLVNALRSNMRSAPDLSLFDSNIIKQLRETTDVEKIILPINNRQIECLSYVPKNLKDAKNLPVILYLHGGGWCIGSPEQYDLVNRKLAITNQARVICPRYRLCPEFPFPAGFDDCCDTYMHLRILPTDNPFYSEKIIVAGDSVGGGFAAALTLRMKDEEKPLPDALLLLSPATDMRLENYSSYNELSKNNLVFDQGIIGFLRGTYVQGDEWDNPYVSPIRGDLSNFPSTFMMVGEVDPLFDENLAFAKKLESYPENSCKTIIGKAMPHHYHTFISLAEPVDLAYQEITNFIKENITVEVD